MPLTPQGQRERRARLKPEPEYQTRRCKNCSKFFKRPVKGRGQNKEFCSIACRSQFHQMGGNAFGPLKTKLEKLVKQWMRSYQQDTDANIIAVRNRLDELATRLDEIVNELKSTNHRLLLVEGDLKDERLTRDLNRSNFDHLKTRVDIQHNRLDAAFKQLDAQIVSIDALHRAMRENAVHPTGKHRPESRSAAPRRKRPR